MYLDVRAVGFVKWIIPHCRIWTALLRSLG